MQYIRTVSKRGAITIPIELRRELGWMGRMKVIIHEVKDGLLIEPADPKAAGSNRGISLTIISPAAAPHDSR